MARWQYCLRSAPSQLKDGEINFWMPLTDYSRTQTTLWVESGPNTGDFHPLALDVGRIAMFHGTLVRHYAPPNPTKCLRVSMDFRVGIGKYYDPDWKLEGLQHYHGRLKIVLWGQTAGLEGIYLSHGVERTRCPWASGWKTAPMSGCRAPDDTTHNSESNDSSKEIDVNENEGTSRDADKMRRPHLEPGGDIAVSK